MGVLTGIAEKHPIPVFAMKDTEECYATNQFASKFENSNFSSIPIHLQYHYFFKLSSPPPIHGTCVEGSKTVGGRSMGNYFTLPGFVFFSISKFLLF